MRKQGYAFHVHHDTLFEWCFDYDERVKYIKKNKPKHERELRLRLFKLIPKGRIPAKLYKAGEVYDKAQEAYYKAQEAYYKAQEAYYKAREAYYKAREAYDKAGAALAPEIEALHKELCPDCPWDGKTIFSKKEV